MTLGVWRKRVRIPLGDSISRPEIGIHCVIDDVKHLWTGRQWVTEDYLREVMNAPRENEVYDGLNRRRDAVAKSQPSPSVM